MAVGWARAFAIATAVAVLTAGCAGEGESDPATTPQDAVSGVVLDGPDGDPAAGVEVELLVWPAVQSSTSDDLEATTLDTAVTDASGQFELEALASELSPYASTAGHVGVELRAVGSSEVGTRTTIRLERARDTGVISVAQTEDVVVVLPADGATG